MIIYVQQNTFWKWQGLPSFRQNLEKKQWCQDLQMAHTEQCWASLSLEGRHESFHTWVFFKVLVTLQLKLGEPEESTGCVELCLH